MSRPLRQIKSDTFCEIICRARSGLPFVPNALMNATIRSVMARTQRDNKVILVSYLWMANHLHCHVVVKDGDQCKKFYMELQKKLTDCVKNLLGIEPETHFSLWERDVRVIRLGTEQDARDRIAYVYNNPTKAGLVDSIGEYPGETSWGVFKGLAGKGVEASVKREVQWLRPSAMRKLKSLSLSEEEAREELDQIGSRIKTSLYHVLEVKPNAWIKVYRKGKVSDEEMERINRGIIREVREKEKKYCQERKRAKRFAAGAERLKGMEIMSPHKPKKKGGRLFVICCDTELRMKIIGEYREFVEKFREAAERWRKGEYWVEWPLGAFRPWLRPLANDWG